MLALTRISGIACRSPKRLEWQCRCYFANRTLTSTYIDVHTLVIAEHNSQKLSPSVLPVITAASRLGGSITVLVAGHDVGIVAASASRVQGVTAVLTAEDATLAHGLAEPAASMIAAIQQRRGFTHIMTASTGFGKNLLPRAAALLDVQPYSDVQAIHDVDTFVRPIYAGNAIATVRATMPGVHMLTVRTTAFQPAVDHPEGVVTGASIEAVSESELSAARGCDGGAEWVGEDVAVGERPELTSAKVVVSGGRALGSVDSFQLLTKLADSLGGAVGASRAAVDAGYVSNDMQVGQTGKMVAPDLYIAVGISGAIQHLAGMKAAKTIVAINIDADAPIFEVADYGLVENLFTAVPELCRLIEETRSNE